MDRTYGEILEELRGFELIRFRSEPEAAELLATMTYDAIVALLTKLSSSEPQVSGSPTNQKEGG